MKILTKFLLVLNVIVVFGLWVTGFLSGLDPEKWGWFSLVGYAFPFFILATIFFLVIWMFIRKRCMLVSIIGLLVAYYHVSLYCPVNFLKPSETLKHSETITVMNYNVLNWGKGYDDNGVIEKDLTDEEKEQVMLDYFKSVDADIVTIEEGVLTGKLDSLKSIYHYTDTILSTKMHGPVAQILSKYPITRKENFNMPDTDNGGGAFWINYKGREIIVVALHLQTMGFSVHEKERFSTMVHGLPPFKGRAGGEATDSVKSTSKTIFGKILQASKFRARQADLVARFIEGHLSDPSSQNSGASGTSQSSEQHSTFNIQHSTPIIVMGDFNDIPQSYTHARICDRLQDCYREKGCGPGYSYKHFGMRVRIDNILCSEDFIPVSCDIDKNITISDHQPIISVLKLKK